MLGQGLHLAAPLSRLGSPRSRRLLLKQISLARAMRMLIEVGIFMAANVIRSKTEISVASSDIGASTEDIFDRMSAISQATTRSDASAYPLVSRERRSVDEVLLAVRSDYRFTSSVIDNGG